MSTVRDDLMKKTNQKIEIADEVEFYSPVTFTELPEQPVARIGDGLTIPSVLNRTRIQLQNVSPVSITNFNYGQEGQELKILGDGQTTLVNGTYITTNTGANKLLATTKIYTFTLFSNVWIENE